MRSNKKSLNKWTEVKESGRIEQHSQNDSTTSKREKIHFDPKTGKKISKEIESITKSTRCTTKKEEWEKIRQERIEALQLFEQMSLTTAKNKSTVFGIYANFFREALIALERLRLKLGLSYTSDDPRTSVWFNVDIVQLFVFGVRSPIYENNKDVPESFQYLTCCWSWMELVAWSTNPMLCARIAQDYFIEPTDRKFLIRSEMIAKHTIGCLLYEHIPKLKQVMRNFVVPFITSSDFPIFTELKETCGDDVGYETVIFSYSFTLCSNLKLPQEDALFAVRDGHCAISVDGLLTKLFVTNNISQKINELFKMQALKAPKDDEEEQEKSK